MRGGGRVWNAGYVPWKRKIEMSHVAFKIEVPPQKGHPSKLSSYAGLKQVSNTRSTFLLAPAIKPEWRTVMVTVQFNWFIRRNGPQSSAGFFTRVCPFLWVMNWYVTMIRCYVENNPTVLCCYSPVLLFVCIDWMNNVIWVVRGWNTCTVIVTVRSVNTRSIGFGAVCSFHFDGYRAYFPRMHSWIISWSEVLFLTTINARNRFRMEFLLTCRSSWCQIFTSLLTSTAIFLLLFC